MKDCSAKAGRPRFDIVDIVREHRAQLEATVQLCATQKRVLSAIELCRTAALGGHIDRCHACGSTTPAYNSCRNRHCPKCQALAAEKWVWARTTRLLPVRHFHVVTTLPAELRPLARAFPRQLYDALFTCTSETLSELASSRLDASLGVTMILHTWTRELKFHPHVHAIVTAGGLSSDGTHWNHSNKKYLFPVEVIGALVKGKMLDWLRTAERRGAFNAFDEFLDPQAFERLISRLASRNWIAYVKKPFRDSIHVMKYLGRYTHRVAIANGRIVDVTATCVTFGTKSGKLVSVPSVEFLRRFCLHVLPPGFNKIRHYGLYSSAASEKTYVQAKQVLESTYPENGAPRVTNAPSPTELSWQEHLRRLTGRDVNYCRNCGALIEHLPIARPAARAPPC
jgi:Putative transposase/Transposase zinc-binding domain